MAIGDGPDRPLFPCGPQYIEVVEASLYPRLAAILQGKPDAEKANLNALFEQHVQVLANFIRQALEQPNGLCVEFFINLHRLLFPQGWVIRALGNDGVEVGMRPGEWRKQVLHHRHSTNTNFSPTEEIEQDFRCLLMDFTARREWSREDVLRFYFQFGNIHPFGDANGTISALVCDVLCQRHSLRPLWLLNVRFKDKPFLFHLISLFENDHCATSLERILGELDKFNTRN